MIQEQQNDLIKHGVMTSITESEIANLRNNFAKNYASKMGWDFYSLSVEQVLEIRSHGEWKNPILINS